MFTGIVEQLGEVVEAEDRGNARRLTISGDDLGTVPTGASIAVNGVCLTAVEGSDGRLSVDVIPETLGRTNLGGLDEGDRVNLERAMPANGRFDGHIVQGHVDATGVVSAVEQVGDDVRMTIDVAEPAMRYVVEKGSVTVDGVSLTVAGVRSGGFTVALIPHTLAVTTLGLRNPGDLVNLEVDVLAKYVERLLKAAE